MHQPAQALPIAPTTMARIAIGTHLPDQGGTLAAYVARPDGSLYGLIVASADHDVTGPWGPYGQDVPGAHGTHGAASTHAMADAGSTIAQAVRSLQIEGHADWYIPSRLELLAAYEQAPQLFDKSSYYWTSSQYSRLSAWCQDFECGGSRADYKGTEFRARPVRSIQLQAVSPSPLRSGCPGQCRPVGEADPHEISAAAATPCTARAAA
ncbi:DUF1566 domain-containing protein [Paracidovorax wautersii]|uniref:Lcl domain-containing protein n=1 Tax=Paracidovorax wautersii TaxID=1177982 RepID=UPI0031D9BA6E